MNNYYFFTVAIVIGIIGLIYGIRLHLKYTKSKEIFSFKVDDEFHNIKLNPGKYSIDILGGGEIINFPMQIFEEGDQRQIDLYKGLPYRYFKNGVMGVTAFNFEIDRAATYIFTIKDINEVRVRQFAPKMLSGLTTEIYPRSLSVVIKQYNSVIIYIISLLLFMISTAIIIFGIVGYLSKLGIIPPMPLL